jgi:hypothetical protein
MKKFTDQTALTAISEIKSECFEELREKLKIINDDLFENKILRLSNIKGVHFCRFVILPESKDLSGKIIPNQLIYSSNFDGTLENHLKEIQASNAFGGFVQIFSCCQGFNENLQKSAVNDFIRKNQKKVHVFYRGYQGLTVDIIQDEQKLCQTIQIYLDENVYDKKNDVQQIKKGIETYVNQKFPNRKQTKEIKLGKLNNILLYILIGLRVIFPLGCIWFVFYIFDMGTYGFWGIICSILVGVSYLTLLECFDKKLDLKTVDDERIKNLTLMEDKIIQNQFSHVVLIKKGLFRRGLQWLVLWFLHTNLKYTNVTGKLSGITSIHFARWAIIDEGRRLIFFSNFDGTWENYLSDFVDRAASGLTLAWSNTYEFPKSVLLVLKGAREENLFKAVVRKNQLFTNVWYSAYPTLTVKEISQNHKIALGIGKKMDDLEINNWLKLF